MFMNLETLFHPALVGSSPDRGVPHAPIAIAESVLSVGLLPERTTFGAAGPGVDLSGLGRPLIGESRRDAAGAR